MYYYDSNKTYIHGITLLCKFYIIMFFYINNSNKMKPEIPFLK